MSIVAIVAGTRPEIIKVAPLFWELKKKHQLFYPKIIFTGQHDSLFWQNAKLFNIIKEDIIFLNKDCQSFHNGNVINQFASLLQRIKPTLMLVQGDTDSALIGSLAAHKINLCVGHVEAGLRSHDFFNPWPEEKNRVHISQLSQLHFAPTKSAVANLLREGLEEHSIYLTGNPIIDTLESIPEKNSTLAIKKLESSNINVSSDKHFIIVTLHRKELYTEGRVEAVFEALNLYLQTHPDVEILFFVHRNPNIREKIKQSYQIYKTEQIILCEPCNFFDMQTLLRHCLFVVTDSGGLQEESSYHGKFCCVVRTNTERVESINHKIAKLCGYSSKEVLEGMLETKSMSNSPETKWLYGDGRASKRIVQIIERSLPNLMYYTQQNRGNIGS